MLATGALFDRAKLRYGARRLLGRKNLSLADVAVSSTEIAPTERRVRPESPRLPGMLDRVRSTEWHADLEKQLGKAWGGPVVDRASVAHTVRDAVVGPLGYFAGGLRVSLHPGTFIDDYRAGTRVPTETIDRALLITTWHGAHWFAEWLYDNNTRALLSGALGADPIELARAKPYLHAPRYEELLELPRRRVRHARVRELVVLDDLGQNSHKVARYHVLRERARRVPGERKGHGVFVVRGRWGKLREVENEDECIAWARARDFTILDPMKVSVDETLAAFKDARYVVGVDGGALLHCLMTMAPDGRIVSILPADRFDIGGKDYADVLGIPYAVLVCDEGLEEKFRVNVEELDATFELVR